MTTTTFPQLGSQYSRLYELSRIVELSDPTSPAASRTYTPSVLSSDASDSEHSLGFRMDKFFDEGSLNVDRESYSMDSVKRSEALSELHPPIRGSEHDWTLEHFPCPCHISILIPVCTSCLDILGRRGDPGLPPRRL